MHSSECGWFWITYANKFYCVRYNHMCVRKSAQWKRMFYTLLLWYMSSYVATAAATAVLRCGLSLRRAHCTHHMFGESNGSNRISSIYTRLEWNIFQLLLKPTSWARERASEQCCMYYCANHFSLNSIPPVGCVCYWVKILKYNSIPVIMLKSIFN